jgi:hypothetical protein
VQVDSKDFPLAALPVGRFDFEPACERAFFVSAV